MTDNKQKTVQWLSTLFYLQLSAIGLMLLNQLSLTLHFSLGGSWITWVRRGINIAIVVCLFLLPMHYRKAAVFKTAWLVCSLLPSVLQLFLRDLGMELYLSISSVLSLATSILSLVAIYLEYGAHAAFAPEKDRSKWLILFVCTLVLSAASQAVAALMQRTLNTMIQNGITWGITV